MEQDEILEIGVGDNCGLYIKPKSLTFPYIYREAMEVHWDEKKKCLYGPKPRKWSYLDWYKQIQTAAREQSSHLLITMNTKWVNIPQELKAEILNEFNASNT